MDFWATTWSAALGGVITFILTAVPVGMVERRHRVKRAGPDAPAAAPEDDHSVGVDVSGDNHGTITAKVEDNRSYRSSKKVKKIVNPEVRPSTSSSGGDAETALGYVFLGFIVLLVLATTFVWAYPFLFVGMACALGVVLGMVAAMCRESYRASGEWSQRESGMAIRGGTVGVGFIATWLVMQSTVRGAMSLEAMNSTVFASPEMAASTTNPVGAFLTAGIERVKIFFTVYGPAGAGFVACLLLSLFVIALVMLSLARSCRDWSLFLRHRGGERLPKMLRRRAKAFGSRSPRLQVVGLIGFIAACVIAVLLATGLGFDGMTLLQNGMVPVAPTP